jgi:hypothetical protein
MIEEKKQENEMPVWLQLAFVVGGAILIGYLLQKLFEFLFGPDKPTKSGKFGKVMPRVFISHSWDKAQHYNTLIKRFDYYNFEFYNHSIPEDRALDVATSLKIENGIRNKMRGCSKVLILAGDYANNYWIKKEVQIAKEMGKEVIAIKPYGADSIPTYLKNDADRIVGFNAKSIIENIKN